MTQFLKKFDQIIENVKSGEKIDDKALFGKPKLPALPRRWAGILGLPNKP